MQSLIHQHGGDLDLIQQKYHIAKQEIIDFSGNINPLGFPESVATQMAKNIQNIISVYPDKRYTKLRKAIAIYTGANMEHVVVGNGSTELIGAFIKTIHAKKSLILVPAYSEYEREVTLTGGTYEYFALQKEKNFEIDMEGLLCALTEEIDLFVACNPNNPTGSYLTTSQLRTILKHCQNIGAAVMIDETYIEFADNINEICAIGLVQEFDNLFVIRGTSKFFAAPGLRLGYGISSNEAFLQQLQINQDPWSVNSLAAFAGEHMFLDTAFHKRTKELISQERKKAYDILSQWSCIKVYPSHSNFLLVEVLTEQHNAAEIFETLIQQKMLIRDASSFAFLNERFLRFCIQLPEQNEMLLNALSVCLCQQK